VPSIATDAPQPANTSLSFPLETDFSQGLPGWIHELGDNLSFEGSPTHLLALEDTVLEIGNDDWQNYSVEYDVEHNTSCLGFGDDKISIYATDEGNMILFLWSHCNSRWDEMVSGKQEKISEGDNIIKHEDRLTLKLSKENNHFQAFVNGILTADILDTKYSQGKAYIFINKGVKIYRISVSN
jgi:hypothetical protein